VGASGNIIEASLAALIDSIEFGLLTAGVRPTGEAAADDKRSSVRPSTRPASGDRVEVS
jgi:hypothetical protein